MYPSKQFVDAGSHVLRGGRRESYRRVTSYVDRIWRAPSLPVCRSAAEKFELVITVDGRTDRHDDSAVHAIPGDKVIQLFFG